MNRILISEAINKIGEQVVLKGWVHVRRNLGKMVFFDLRDMSGLMQVIIPPSADANTIETAKAIRPEYVVAVTGTVQARKLGSENDKLSTGKVEILAEKLEIISEAKTPPFEIENEDRQAIEELRLKYRYLDLRHERMARNIKQRSNVIRYVIDYLTDRGFVYIQTPILSKSTPEGARDYLVPSRVHKGKFFALPQSPQQYKQLLMVAGFERYFQFPHCLRDEDLRADRGFEHTQLDLEMSFVTREEVMQAVEEVVKEGVKAVGGKLKDETFPVVSYRAAMDKYGADKFDLRTEAEKKNGVLAFAWVTDFPFFRPVNKEEISDKFDSKSEWTFTHNPFSMPIPEHVERLLAGKNIGEILTTQYDLVCNGLEAGGGSIRAHTPELLKATYKIMGYSDSQIEESVGHMLEAFSFGAPPHGGIALGIDRHIALLKGELSIKETMAFPMTSSGRTSVMDAPASVPENILKELGIKVISDDKVSS